MKGPRIVIFTGSGVSAESGLQTFRNGGLWESVDPRTVATPEAWTADPARVLRFYNQRIREVRSAQPNAAHFAIIRLEEKFEVDVVTQNIDDLHERVGSTRVLHLHGKILEARSSVDPSLLYAVGDSIELGQHCAKGSPLRPAFVRFGEPVEMMPEAKRIIRRADLLVVVGTSLQVTPASDLVHDAHYCIHKFIIDPELVETGKIHLLHRIRQSAGLGRYANACGRAPKWQCEVSNKSTKHPLVTPVSMSTSPTALFDVPDFERQAKAQVSTLAWEYISDGAADELTMRWNREAYDRIRLKPRVLVDVSQLDTRVTLLGREHAFPLLLAPTAYQKLMHPEGELATVNGANTAGTTMIVSSFATVTLEDIAAEAQRPLWFQLYVQPTRDITRDLIKRAEAAGYEALVLTVDTPVLGARYRELRVNFTLPPGLERANLRGLATATGGHRFSERNIYSPTHDPTLTWKDLDWFRSVTRLPILLKGVLNPDDAERAVQAGVAGIIVSNHGGRNLDTLPATIDILPEVTARVAGRIPVLVDGGIRRGTDILKAIAFGATAVLIGRPYLYGLAAEGAPGVTRIVNILRREFEMAMALSGRTSLTAIDASVIWR